jgi:hypothetical protein
MAVRRWNWLGDNGRSDLREEGTSSRRDPVAALQTFRQAEFFQLADFLLEGGFFEADARGEFSGGNAFARGD